MHKSVKLPPLRGYNYSPDVSLRIRPLGHQYLAEVRAYDDYFDEFMIPMTSRQVEALNTHLRKVLQQLVDETDELNVSKAKSAKYFKELAGAGALAYGEVFKNRLTETSRLLSTLSPDQPASIQIVSEDFSLPWELLHVGDSSSDGFWGTSWLISRIAVYPVRADSEIRCGDTPTIGLVADHRLDAVADKEIPFFADLHKKHHIHLLKLRDLRPTAHDHELSELRRFFRNNPLQVAHFACHAQWDESDPYSSAIEPPLDFSVSFREIKTIRLNGKPLVFLNACETGNVRPEYALFFSKEFLGCGARAVVATHCEVPDQFAAAFAERFYRRFLDGEPVGHCLLATRRAFAVEGRNPGLRPIHANRELVFINHSVGECIDQTVHSVL